MLCPTRYYKDKAKGYMRDAEYYTKKAEGYDREAEYYNKKAQRYLREADYYSKSKKFDKSKTYSREQSGKVAPNAWRSSISV